MGRVAVTVLCFVRFYRFGSRAQDEKRRVLAELAEEERRREEVLAKQVGRKSSECGDRTKLQVFPRVLTESIR